MAQTHDALQAAREYNMGAMWAATSFLLLLVIMAWYAGSLTPIVDSKLAVFLVWLHAVPLVAIYLHRILP